MSLTQAQSIECFHLALLQVLPTQLKRDHYVVKGGANLRYFFNSVRYSEDIDFDALMDDAWRLEDKVDAALAAKALTIMLRQQGLQVTNVSKSKQSDTTQRWKILLNDEISTKVEFSRRNGDRRWELEAVPEDVVRPYGIRPPTLNHYLAAPAIEQKIAALALRREAQTRDVFDLELLFRGFPDEVSPGAVGPGVLTQARARCLELPFEAFEAQVIPFLDSDMAALYDDPGTWDQIQLFVESKLEALDA